MANPLSIMFFLALIPFISALHHIPLQRNPVPAARLFSFAKRPWARGISRQPQLNLPLKLLNNSRPLRDHPMYGSIVPLGEYYLTLDFGGQPINVQIDTGSSTMAIPLSECTNCPNNDHRLDMSKATGTAGFIACNSLACRPNSCHAMSTCTTCHKKTRACCSTIAPSACGFFLLYADQSGASGALVQTDVTIAQMTVPLVYGAILRETNSFEGTNVDGILGMAYKSLACNPTCVAPLFDTLVQSGKVSKDIFSLCTAPEGGTLTLGGSDPKFYEGELQYVPMKHEGTKTFYSIDVKGLHAGDRKVGLPTFSNAIVDSGTTLIAVTPKAYDTLKAHFQTYHCDVPGLCTTKASRQLYESTDIMKADISDPSTMPRLESAERVQAQTWFSPGYCARLSDQHIALLPNVTIRLDKGIELVIEPELYMLKYETTTMMGWDRTVYRCLGITPLDGLELMSNNVILGNTVLQKYFVEYDRENDRIGFAEARNCVDPTARKAAEYAPAENGGLIPGWIMRLLTVGSVCAWLLVILICARDARKRQGYAPISNDAAAS